MPTSKSPSSTSSASSPTPDARPSSSQTDEAAKKARIIKHMNADHTSSLSLYLQHYCSLSPSASSSPRLVDISLSSLAIASTDGKAYTVPIEPPLSNWADMRPRLVEMDAKSRAALGLGDGGSSDNRERGAGQVQVQVRVTEYIPPTSALHLFMIALVFFLFGSVYGYRRGLFVPGNWFYENIMRYFPYGPTGYLFVQNWVGVPLFVGSHVVETLWMVVRLRKRGVKGGVWWKWVGSCALEGFGAHQRFGEAVRRAEERKREGKRRH